MSLRRHARWAIVIALLPADPANAVAGDMRLHLRSEVRGGYAEAGSIWRGGEDAWLADAALTVRPMFERERGRFRFVGHLEAIATVGDSRERVGDVASVFGRAPVDGRADLVDLTHVWSEGRRHRDTLRIDRLALAYSPSWGTVTFGRHAVTWGGGLVFNPFDLFNPFAPGDVVRDFKTGSDMVHVDIPWSGGGLQALAVGRRDAVSGHFGTDTSSFALLANRTTGRLECTGLVAAHYGEPVVGFGVGGEVAGATWHVDGVWVRVNPSFPAPAGDYCSLVANLQYAWQLDGKNAYGFIEYHYNGLGHSEPREAALDPLVQTQSARGNLFVLGRHQLAASLQLEWHPLLNIFASVIANAEDGSMIVQPRVLWDASTSLRLTAGLDLPVGPKESEYGGNELPGGSGTTRSPVAAYVLATWEF